MLFSSWPFLIFLLCAFAVYYLIPVVGGGTGIQVSFLVLASFVFYGFDGPWLTLLLGGSVLANVVLSDVIVHRIRADRSPRAALAAGVTLNLAILGFFKYAGFLAETLLPGEGLAGVRSALKSIPLPIGISFFTFHMISLLVDLVRLSGSGGVASLEKEYLDRRTASAGGRVALYVAFFPQLIAGPILKAHEFFGQVRVKRFGEIDWAAAGRFLVLGYFLKMVIADNLREATGLLTTPLMPMLGALDLLALLYGFSFQIFADFAGYSLIALGLGKLFGYQLPVNFNFPYLAASVTEFWRRWHISLSTFLRDYLYIPLGGNRKGPSRTYVNLAVVMLFGGLWHGANWTFVAWGAMHGALLACERGLGKDSLYAALPRPARVAVTMTLVLVTWVLFRAESLSAAGGYLAAMFGLSEPASGSLLLSAEVYTPRHLGVMLLCILLTVQPVQAFDWSRRSLGAARVLGLLALFVFSLVVMSTQAFNPFLYFQF
jgi:alginate O-acetyltransferase complex protein AlgI